MCGIYGISKVLSQSLVEKKLSKMEFRGPDNSNYVIIDNRCTFGHNRLSIIDVDARSNQPFSYLGLTIVFNGEIYNFQELKSKLEGVGYLFNTSSDTEVLCAMYHHYGENCLNYLEGMFSFVIYDRKKNNLFGARDRFGQKPFYYSLDNNTFEFSSQLSSITIDKNFALNEDAVSKFFAYKYIPEPYTIYKEVNKLRAGYCFYFDLSKNSFISKPYFQLPFKNEVNSFINYNEAKEQFNDIFHASIKKRLITDVPLGVFLSGGVDSSLVTAFASEIYGTGLKTFSIKFDEKGFDESVFAEKVANYLGTDHTTIHCNYDEGLVLIDNYHKYIDEPFSDASAIPSMLLAKHTRKHVTVAISGDGGDESFIGYERYKAIEKAALLYKLPYKYRKNLSKILSYMPSNYLQLVSRGMSEHTIGDFYKLLMTNIAGGLLLNPNKGLSFEYDEYLETNKPLQEKLSDYDIKTYLNGDINTKVDRASMAFSLEVRSPFLDKDIVSFAKSLPLKYKYGKGNNNMKIILKDILSTKIPKHLFDRPKAGFTMPFNKWFRTELKEMVYDTLTDKNLKNIPNFNIPKFKSYIDEHMTMKHDRYGYIWSVIVYLKWLENKN